MALNNWTNALSNFVKTSIFIVHFFTLLFCVTVPEEQWRDFFLAFPLFEGFFLFFFVIIEKF